MTRKSLPSSEAALAEIKRLYYHATRQTIDRDIARAVELLKSMPGEEERERASAYMDGLSQMRAEWRHVGKAKKNREIG